jgi:hypothetical protein
MAIQATTRVVRILVVVFATVLLLGIFLVSLKHFDTPTRTNRNVYIAFGFHVNLYHSFRSDANDDGAVASKRTVTR